MQTGKNFINGKWIEGKGSKFESIDPGLAEIIWQGNAANASQVDETISAARNAFEAWSEMDFDKRVSFLEKFTEALKANRDELAGLIAKETGKPLWESNMETGGMISKLKIALKAFEERTGTVVKDIASGKSITRHKPHGVVAVFGPFNFPGHIANGHIIPALLAGNTVVFKPSEQTPLVAERIMQLWESTGIPNGVINLLQGARETGAALSKSKNIDGLFFTGSSQTGTLLHKQFSGQPEKILALEMGGNNPLIVHEIDDHEAAAYIAIQSAYITAGQRCVCARRLMVPIGDEGDQFIETLKTMTAKLQVGHYSNQPEPFLGSLISEKAATDAIKAQKDLEKQGGQILLEMKSLKAGSGLVSPGLMDSTNIKNQADQEIFAPFLQVYRVKDFDEAIAKANQTAYGLSAGIISKNKKLYEKFFQKSRAGIVNWNNQMTGASSSAPFGGVGCSGNHRPSAYYAADYCSYPIASLESEEIKMPEVLSPGIVR